MTSSPPISASSTASSVINTHLPVSSIIGAQAQRAKDGGPFGLRYSVTTATISRRYTGLASSLQLDGLMLATKSLFKNDKDHWKVCIEFLRYLILVEEMEPSTVEQISMLPPPAVLQFWFALRHQDDNRAYRDFCRFHNFTPRFFPQKAFSEAIEAGKISAFLSAFGQLQRYFVAGSEEEPLTGYSPRLWSPEEKYTPYGSPITP